LRRHVKIGAANDIAIHSDIITRVKRTQPEAVKIVICPQITYDSTGYVVNILKLLEVGGICGNLKFVQDILLVVIIELNASVVEYTKLSDRRRR
jgi:hypothetical protein